MVGHRFVEALRRAGRPRWDVASSARRPRPAYDRVALSSYFDGKTAEDLRLPATASTPTPLVELHLGDPAVAVDRAARGCVRARPDGARYDALVLATGS